MPAKVRFTEIKQVVPAKPGIYEIYTVTGTPLKVGIGGNLRKRLLQHHASRQSCLRLKPDGNWSNPKDVVSKGSILAKHLYYDSRFSKKHNLTTEAGRRMFLEENCFITFKVTPTRELARELEKLREQQCFFRYCSQVQAR